jgi:hypothetical protein
MAEIYHNGHSALKDSMIRSEDMENGGLKEATASAGPTRDKPLVRGDMSLKWGGEEDDRNEEDGEDTPLMSHGHAAGFQDASPVVATPLPFPFSAGEKRKSFYFPSERCERDEEGQESREAELEKGAVTWAESCYAEVHRDATLIKHSGR